jgi:hypothetical protein
MKSHWLRGFFGFLRGYLCETEPVLRHPEHDGTFALGKRWRNPNAMERMLPESQTLRHLTPLVHRAVGQMSQDSGQKKASSEEFRRISCSPDGAGAKSGALGPSYYPGAGRVKA